MFQNYETVQQLMENTTTDEGLTLKVRIHLKEYQTGTNTLKSEVDDNRFQYHKDLPELNYRMQPVFDTLLF
jgi:Rhodopirellula transposase DDE domain